MSSNRILMVTAALGVLVASNAFASRARDIVLGTGDAGFFLSGADGSFFYDDNRNIFYNPAYVNDFKNWATIEKSNYVAGTATSATTGAGQTGITAEGGFVTSMMNYNLGFYFNRISGEFNNVGNEAAINNTRPLEVFFGGDAGMAKYGASLFYGSDHITDNTSTNLILRLGAEVGDFMPFGWASLVGKDNTTTPGTDVSQKTYGLGFQYKMGEWAPYAGWRMDKYSGVSDDVFLLGIGRSTKIAEGARLNYAVHFDRNTNNRENMLPVDLSAEADANSWLTLRAGLTYRFWDRIGDVSNTDTTSARIGAGIHVGKADFDFAVGKATSALASTTFESNNSPTSNQVFDIGPGFFTAAGMTYHW